MTEIAISLRGIGKRYWLGELSYRGSMSDQLGQAFRGMFRRPVSVGLPKWAREEFWALRDINLDIRRGEVMGVVGRNGSGKSTLMKILARITTPTVGSGALCGRVGALLEVGTGFHPDLTGRENIFMNGTVLGLTRPLILARLDEIIGFSEIERFIDLPVKFYSSGMFARLAFAVMAHLDADIMLVDEITAVGDAGFEQKALMKIREIVQAGRTVVFISHDMTAIRRLCDRCLVLDGGRIAALGDVENGIVTYERLCHKLPTAQAETAEVPA